MQQRESVFRFAGGAALGRDFLPEDDQPGHGDGILLNDVAWEKFFNKRADVIGQSLKMGEKVYTVIGVMPPGFEFPSVGDGPTVWQPLLSSPAYEARDSRALTAWAASNPESRPRLRKPN